MWVRGPGHTPWPSCFRPETRSKNWGLKNSEDLELRLRFEERYGNAGNIRSTQKTS